MSTDYQIRINKMNCELMLTYDTPAYMFNVTQESQQQQPESAEKLHQTGEQSARDSTDTQRPETGILCCRY
jgi:hypothetical protein